MRRMLALACLAVLPCFGRAELPFNPYDETVTPGFWCGNFESATNYATQHDLPMVFVWGKLNCPYCTNTENALGLPAGLSWAQNLRTANGKSVVFCFVRGTRSFADNPPNYGAMEFAQGAGGERINGTPYVCLYWPNRKTERFSAQTLPSASEAANPSQTVLEAILAQFESRVEAFLASVKPERSYVTFPMGDTPNDRLEAEAGVTRWVGVPLVRTNATALAASSRVKVCFGSSVSVKDVSWAAEEVRKLVSFDVPPGLSVGQRADVTLMETDGTVLAVRHIWGVGEAENSPKNPRWIGERTVESLAWGEWTMDFEVAKQKAANAEIALTLVLVGGSLWCPDCYSTDRFLIDTPAFRQWAKDNRVACVAIDVANPKGTANTSLLTWNPSRVSDRYCTCNNSEAANEDLRYESGAGYLSRHQVSSEEAQRIFDRNQFLLCTSTLEGGLCRPEDAAGDGKVYGFKTGIPCLILLRADGTIAGRIYQFNNVSASSDKDLAAHIERLNELVRQAAVPQEEDNDDVSTTEDAIPVSCAYPVRATLSAVDGRDVYRIDGRANDRVTFSLSGEKAATFALTVTDDSSAVPITLGTTQGRLDQGVSLSVKLTSDRCHLAVDFPKDGDGYAQGHFSFASVTPTECEYVLRSVGGESGGEFGFAVPVMNVREDCGTASVVVSREAGSHGRASVRVKLVEISGESAEDRVVWTDETVSWADGEYGEKSVPLELKPDGEVRGGLKLVFRLDELSGDAGDLEVGVGELSVNVLDADCFGMLACRHVFCENAQAIKGWREGDLVAVSVKSGFLPYGLELVCADGQLKAAGFAHAAPGEYSAVCLVTLLRDGSSQELSFDFTVREYDFTGALPSLAKTRTYGNLPLVVNDEIAGLLTVTVPADGTLSARYVTDGKAYAYATDGWASFDSGSGRLTAILEQTEDPFGPTMSVVLTPEGGVASFADPSNGTVREFGLQADVWSRGADAWQGQYAVQLPQTNVVNGLEEQVGAAYMALRMVDDVSISEGRMLYAGVLPNGRAVYGCSTLIDAGAGSARLPFYHVSDMRSAPFAFSGGFAIRAGAQAEHQLVRQSVTKAWKTAWWISDGRGRSSEFNVFGGYYEPSAVTACFNADFKNETDNFAFLVATGGLSSGRYGVCETSVAVQMEMTATNCPQIVADAYNPQNVKLKFSLPTGVVSGTFEIPFAGRSVPVTFRGIALPGWQGCEDCATGFVERPWAVGACAFSDFENGFGTYRNGCGIRLDRYQ